ncbi:MAG: hypothetical protein LJE68_06550 [Rhodobacter sp.]|jgi:hypothetical protein|nr:hypothetical protein [Rhodobacter sp.]
MHQTSIQETRANVADFQSNDYHRLPVTEKQLVFARQIALRSGVTLPLDVQNDREALSGWIGAHRNQPRGGQFSNYPSSRQVAFAERIARLKRRNVPDECFRDRGLMSKWIDHNL